MTTQMDPVRAARLLEKWINFYGMDDPHAWPPEDYPYVKRACEAMRATIEVLRGNPLSKSMKLSKVIALLEDWPTVHCMDDPDSWDPLSFPFVRNALDSLHFAVAFLKDQRNAPTL